jgi:tRNA (cmo5U34)-methyltransferase
VPPPHSHSERPAERHSEPPPVMGGQWHFDPDSYLRMVRSEVPAYDRLQAALANATVGRAVQSVLDLGSGTGVSAEHVLRVHPGAALTGIDSSEGMLVHARRRLPGATFLVSRLEDPLPDGPFDLVVSSLAIHHVDHRGKVNLFRRVASALTPGGRFAFLDVVASIVPVSNPVPIEPGVDLPSTASDLLHWLREADLEPQIVVDEGDLAVITADRQY